MALPKLNSPTYELEQPSTGEMIKYSVISNVEFLKYINENIYKIINSKKTITVTLIK